MRKRVLHSKTFAFSMWCIGIIVVAICFLAQGNGAFNFMGGEHVVGVEINTWLVAALGFGVAALTVSVLIAGNAYRRPVQKAAQPTLTKSSTTYRGNVDDIPDAVCMTPDQVK